MKRFALVLCTLAVLTSSAAALDTPTPAAPAHPAAVLSKAYAATLGDVIASTMGQLVPVAKERAGWGWGLDGPVVVIYDRTSAKLVVSVYGIPPNSNDTGVVDKAKSSLEYFRGKVFPMAAACISQSYGVSLDESDVTLVYFNRVTMNEVLRREGTKYLVSSE